MQIRIRDPESFCPWIQDPGWKNSDPGSEINIPDPQHYFPDPHHYIFGSLIKKNNLKHFLLGFSWNFNFMIWSDPEIIFPDQDKTFLTPVRI
jgi:hypothetical protein